MLDENVLKQKVRVELFGHWSILFPLGASAIPFSYAAFLADNPGAWLFGGIACLLTSLGTLSYRWIVKRDEIIATEVEKVRSGIVNAQQSKLDSLRNKLASDNDRRDEHLYDDLVNVRATFLHDSSWKEGLDDVIVAEITNKIEGLFANAIKFLEKSFDMRQSASRMPRSAQLEVKKSADRLLDDVERALQELGSQYARAQELAAKRLTASSMGGKALEQNLDEMRTLFGVAERAEDRLRSGIAESDAEYLREIPSDKPV